jgi:hypothetical protein
MSANIAIIHAVRVAVSPIEKTFERLWPDAKLVNILDETLSRDLAKTGASTAWDGLAGTAVPMPSSIRAPHSAKLSKRPELEWTCLSSNPMKPCWKKR